MHLLEYFKELTKSAEAAGKDDTFAILPVGETRQLIAMCEGKWIKDRYPDNEKDVLIIVEHRLPGRPAHRRVIRAFYEDGLMPLSESEFFWEDFPSGIVPAGWYETTDYGDNYEVIDPVIGWQPLPDPWEKED